MASREELPRFVPPMLARTAPVPKGDAWALEVKFDGMRLQLRRDGGAVCLRSRPGRDCTEEFPERPAVGEALGRHRVLLDGELVCLAADAKPDFARLRRRLRAPADKARVHAERRPASFLAFDLLHLDGRSTRELPYERRRELLLQLALDGPAWRTPRHFLVNRGLAATVLDLAGEARAAEGPFAPEVIGRVIPSRGRTLGGASHSGSGREVGYGSPASVT